MKRVLPLWTSDSSRSPTASLEPATGSFKFFNIPKRYTRLLSLLILTTLILVLLTGFDQLPYYFYLNWRKLPPLYDQFNEFERRLPQHDLSLPYPEGKHAKFIHFANHQDGERAQVFSL